MLHDSSNTLFFFFTQHNAEQRVTKLPCSPALIVSYSPYLTHTHSQREELNSHAHMCAVNEKAKQNHTIKL